MAALLTSSLAAIGWAYRHHDSEIEGLRDRMSENRTAIAENGVKIDALSVRQDNHVKHLERIEGKIDRLLERGK